VDKNPGSALGRLCAERSLRRSRSIKVTNFDKNRKPACDFILANNINLILSRTVFHFVQYWSYYRLSLTHSFSAISLNIAINHIFSKSRFFGLHFCFRHYRSNLNHFNVIGPKATEFGEMTQNNGHYTVQGHSRSSIFIPTTARMRLRVNNTNLHPISHRFQVMADY